MKDSHEILLYIAFNLAKQNQNITIDAISQNLKMISHAAFDLETELAWLVKNGFLANNDLNEFILTGLGKYKSFQINKQRMKAEFNQLINRATDSNAYLDFCEEIYGYRMYLFNMMDKNQLDYLFNSIMIEKSDIILDLGCGNGSILNNLVAKYECYGIGIDQLSQDIIKKNSKLISYIEGDIDLLSVYNIKPNITLSIDSLYFSNDLERLIISLKNIKNNRLYLYYSQYISDDTIKDRTILHHDYTKIARILQKNGIIYNTIDYSANERALYENILKVLPKYQKAFEEEGNNDLYENKLRVNRNGKELYDQGLASRYLYIVE